MASAERMTPSEKDEYYRLRLKAGVLSYARGVWLIGGFFPTPEGLVELRRMVAELESGNPA